MKTITHPVYGALNIEPFLLDLLHTPEVQRLRELKQLGLVDLVFPGATHTRLLHALGVSHNAGRFAKALNLTDAERKLVQAAALLHDIGHYPCSHTCEPVVERIVPDLAHEDISAWLITGKRAFNLPGAGNIPLVLRSHGIDPESVAQLVTGTYAGPRYLQDVVSGAVDADRMDYLVLDAHYTGVKAGAIDTDRVLKTLTIDHGRIGVLPKGAPIIDLMQDARDYMTAEVYVQHTVRIARCMLNKAIELYAPVRDAIVRITLPGTTLPDFYHWGDAELMLILTRAGSKTGDLIRRIRYNRDELYKTAFQLLPGEDAATEARLVTLDEREIEDALCKTTGLQPGDIIVDKRTIEKTWDEEHLERKGVHIAPPAPGKASNYAWFVVYCDKTNVEHVRQAVSGFLHTLSSAKTK